jgi:hypothetical protein
VTADQCLIELGEELKKGRIVEARLRATDAHIDGMCDYGSDIIYIDPRSSIVSTLIHELIHRRWPSWSEGRVAKAERWVLAHMTPDDVSRWYRAYVKAKRTRLTVVNADE